MTLNETEKLTASDKIRLTTYKKLEAALEILKKGKKAFTLEDVAMAARISRRTLYNRQDLMDKVKEAQSLMNDKLNPEKRKHKKAEAKQAKDLKEYRLMRLKEQNKELVEDKKKLLEENMWLTSENTDLKRKIANLEDKLFKDDELRVVSIK